MSPPLSHYSQSTLTPLDPTMESDTSSQRHSLADDMATEERTGKALEGNIESEDHIGKDIELDIEKHPTKPDNEKPVAINRTVTAQNWTSPLDPENPHNFPLWERIYITSVPALMGFVVTLGSSIYVPSIPDIIAEFHVSSTVALLGLSTWVLGLAFGPILAAPISETFGRSMVYRISLPLCALFTLGAGFATNIGTIIILRFFSGFFGAPTLAVGAGTNADVWPPVHRAAATVLFVFAPFAGPALGPVIGGYASQAKGWKWTQWPILFVAAFVFIYALPMRETHKKIILQRRAKRLGIQPPVQHGPTGTAALKAMLTITLIRPLHMIFTEPIVGFFSLYIAFNFSVLFAFFAAFPIVFQGVYGMSRGESGLPWLAVLIGCCLSVITVIIVDRLYYRKKHIVSLAQGMKGFVEPEHRLIACMLGSLGLPVGLFWFAWTARSDIHWIIPTLASIPFAWGNLCVFVSFILTFLSVSR